ncbi:MAG: type II secretion system protein [Phycisphaerales bacterium]|nr:type II secretion system protein [Phycisphaerales bacterium]
MKRSAMTLIELLAALVILSAVAAAAARTLQEASASARESALRAGAAQAIAACPDLTRALAGGALETEAWPRQVATADGQVWRVGFSVPEPAPPDEAPDVADGGQAGSAALQVVWATVVVERRGESGSGEWIEARRFETPVPLPEPTFAPNARGSSRRRRWRVDRICRDAERHRSAMTLIETLASLAILSMLAGVVGVWTTSTLRLQSRIAASGPDGLIVALSALRADLDSALLGESGPAIHLLDDGAALEIIAPPRGPGLGMLSTPPAWRTVRWRVDPALSALARTEIGDSDSTWLALENVAAWRAEIIERGASTGPLPRTAAEARPPDAIPGVSLAVRIERISDATGALEFRWESTP